MALNEGSLPGEFLISEANGSISRDEIVVAAGAALAAGTVLGKITASGKYVAYSNAAADGSETARGVLYAPLAASASDRAGVIISRHAEVIGDALTGNDTPGTADLAALQIIVR